jgi:predicted enzyme related to lactoylglutathione lyase
MSVFILLRCLDIGQTRTFYESVLGFNVVLTMENTITVTNAGANLVFTNEDLWHLNPSLSGTIYITVADIDQYFYRIASNAPVAWPLQSMPYGSREFAIIDCNGYLIAFQQDASKQ